MQAIRTIKSTSCKIENSEFSISKLEEYLKDNAPETFIVIWNQSNFVIDVYNSCYIETINQSITNHQLLEARIFNTTQEVRIFQRMSKWSCTRICDNVGNTKEYFDSQQIVTGKRLIKDNNENFYLQQMGQKIHIGKKLVEKFQIQPNMELPTPLILVTRNYIEPNDLGQYGIKLTRMVGIK